MKKFFILPACIMLVMNSCDSPLRLSESKAKALATEYLEMEEMTEHYCILKTGFYEENDEDVRYELRQLAANNVITYEAERITSKERYVKDWHYKSYWSFEKEYEYAYRTKDIYFVTVALTKKGEKLVVDEVKGYEKPYDRYAPYIDMVSYPEDTVSAKEYFPGDEKPQVMNKENATSGEEQVKDPVREEKEKTEYDLLKEKEYCVENIVRAYSIRVADVRNFIVKDGTATCRFVPEVYDTTPFGRIMKNVRNGYRDEMKLSCIYYQDKGWKLYE